ncbi:MAG: hypothetical protein WBG32_12115 [Nodosilinea sp.]
MASSSPLTGVILVDCARANASEGLAIAAERCGYGNDTAKFQTVLRSACSEMNVEIAGLSDLEDNEPAAVRAEQGMHIAPDTPSDL